MNYPILERSTDFKVFEKNGAMYSSGTGFPYNLYGSLFDCKDDNEQSKIWKYISFAN